MDSVKDISCQLKDICGFKLQSLWGVLWPLFVCRTDGMAQLDTLTLTMQDILILSVYFFHDRQCVHEYFKEVFPYIFNYSSLSFDWNHLYDLQKG